MYPERELYREITFIAYYLHWTADEILALPHEERRRFCREISDLHDSMTERPKNPFEID